MDRIAKGLEADGILTGAGKTKWWTSTINKILRNEKYIGGALLQKTYTTDFLNKTRVKNNGIVPQYYVEGNHEGVACFFHFTVNFFEPALSEEILVAFGLIVK